MIRRLIVALAVLAAGLVQFPAAAQDVSTPRGFVTDGANVIDDATERDLETRLSAFERRTRIEIAVVTVPSLGGASIEAYVTRLWAAWGVGKKDTQNGVIVLLAANDRQTQIETGRGLVDRLPDAVCARIVADDMIPDFREQRFSRGLVRGVDSLFRALSEKEAPMPRATSSTTHVDGSAIGGSCCVLLVVALVVAVCLAKRGGGGGPGGGGGRPGFGAGLLAGRMLGGRPGGFSGGTGGGFRGFGGGLGGGGRAGGRF